MNLERAIVVTFIPLTSAKIKEQSKEVVVILLPTVGLQLETHETAIVSDKVLE